MIKASVTLAGRPRKWTINGVAACSKRVNSFVLMKAKEDEGAQDEEGNGFLQVPFDSSQGFDHDIGEQGDPQRRDLEDEIGTFTRNDPGGQIATTTRMPARSERSRSEDRGQEGLQTSQE